VAAARLASVLRQRVQMCMRTLSPFLNTSCRCTLALNTRFVLWARRYHLPPCLCWMLRPNWVPFPHSSHLATVQPPVVYRDFVTVSLPERTGAWSATLHQAFIPRQRDSWAKYPCRAQSEFVSLSQPLKAGQITHHMADFGKR
jgi:hypothetical protein